MIVFDLACACSSTFEGWFNDRHDFENQLAAALIQCPSCGGRQIRKILSPIRFHSSCSEVKASAPNSSNEPVAQEEVDRALATLQKFVEENFEDVGGDLAKESLKMYYGVSEPRNIRGVTTDADEKKLRDEGINLLKVPMPVKNKELN